MCSFDVMRNEACSQLVELRELKATSTAWVYRAISYVHAGQTHLVTGSFSTRIHGEMKEGTGRAALEKGQKERHRHTSASSYPD